MLAIQKPIRAKLIIGSCILFTLVAVTLLFIRFEAFAKPAGLAELPGGRGSLSLPGGGSATPTLEPPPCPEERFTDVCPTDYFYEAVLALTDDGIVSGYKTYCPGENKLWVPCFQPYGIITRGQITKVISLAANFNEPVGEQIFEDVTPGSTFYTYTQRLAARNIIVGYTCNCYYSSCEPGPRPYFCTAFNVSRGQFAKIIARTFEWNEPVAGQQFEDILPGSTFYEYIGRLHGRGLVEGYPCGGPTEPCGPSNLPYYRPNDALKRGQTAKIVQLARTLPTVSPTANSTDTPTTIATDTTTATPTETATSVATETITATSSPTLVGESAPK